MRQNLKILQGFNKKSTTSTIPYYSQVPLQRSPIYNDIKYVTVITVAQMNKILESQQAPYLALTGDLWVSIVRISEKNDRVITALHCIYLYLLQ